MPGEFTVLSFRRIVCNDLDPPGLTPVWPGLQSVLRGWVTGRPDQPGTGILV